MNLRRILAIAGIEQKRVLRDRPSLSLMLLLPAVQILLFGFAVRIEPHELPVALIGADARIEAIAETIATDTRLNLTFRASAGDPLVLLRDKGAMIVVSADPEGRLRIDADGANPVAARVALEAIEQRMLEVANTTFPVMLPQFDLHWAFNPSLQSAWVLVPGLGGAIVMIGMLLLGAQSIVREREEGGWEALRLSPLSGAELLVGKLLPYLPIAVAQEGLVLLIGAGLFALPFGFGALALLALTVPFAAAHLAWGLRRAEQERRQLAP